MTIKYHEDTGQDGIYYDMPSDHYHKLERFSSSGIKKILVSAQDFWVSSWMNEKRYQSESDAFNLGTAYHTRILEGITEFNRLYSVVPVCDKRTKDGKAIFADWQTRYPDAIPIDNRTHSEILAAGDRIENNGVGDYFKNGRPEVSILWTDEETGVPMKSRLDYLKPLEINDLKTFSNSRGLPINRLIASHIANFGYHVQAVVYMEAFKKMPRVGNSTAIPAFNFIFQQTGAANNCVVKPFSPELLLASQGRDLMRRGIDRFAECFRKYGTKPWFDEEGIIRPLRDEDFPIYVYEEDYNE